MKTRSIILLTTIASICMVTVIVIGCKKDSDPEPLKENKIKAWVVGDQDSTTYGMILYTEDGGESWVRQGQGSPALQGIDVNDIYVIDSANVWAVCSRNVIIRTTDGGKTWNRVPAPSNPADPGLFSIFVANNNRIWISGAHGVVYKSDNDGNNWTVFDTNFFQSGFMQGIHAITPDIVYVVGQHGTGLNARGFIAITRDAGTSWDTIAPPDDYNKWWWIGVKATNTDNVIIHGQLGHYTISQDNGLTWKNDSIMKSGCQSQDMNDLVMVSPLIFWCAGDNYILKTTNGGSSWMKQSSDSSPFCPYQVSIDAINDQTAIIVWENAGGENIGKIQKTTDGGNTWTLKLEIGSRLKKVSYVH